MSTLAHRHISTLTVDWYLPGTNSGGPVRSIANLVSALPEIDFYIITRNTDYCSTEPYEGIPANNWVQQEANVWVYYFSEDQLTKGKMKEVIQGTQAGSLYVSGIYSRAFSQWPVSLGKSLGIKTIVAARGMLSPHALAVKQLKKYFFLSFMRWINTYRHVYFHATSDQEAQDIRKVLGANTNVKVVSNLGRLERTPIQTIQKEIGLLKLVSVGRISPEKGTLVGLKALHTVYGKVELDLYGMTYNSAYWKECEKLIITLPSNIKVNYHGPCPSEAVAAKLNLAHALLLPSEGENYGHAIVESLAQGRPVLISQHTPWRNLAVQNAGWDMSASELSSAIQTLIDMNQQEYNIWSKGALKFHAQIITGQRAEVLSLYKQLLG